MSSYALAPNHLSMVFDGVRNRAYTDAIRSVATEDTIVLDLGAGLGVHGLVAARLGVRRVYLVDSETIVDTAAQIAVDNGLADRVVCLRQRIEEATLPEPVDLVISVLTGNFLLTEDLLPYLFLARDRFLSPRGRLIPDRATMEVVAVSAPDLFERHVAQWSAASEGIDFSAVRRAAANWVHFDQAGTEEAEWLSDPAVVLDLDLSTATRAECRHRVELDFDVSGVCHGLVGWFSIRLGEHWLSTSPRAPRTHWSPAFLPVDPPLQVEAGGRATLELIRPERGDWSWSLEVDGVTRRHSTFFAKPLALDDLKKKAADYKPGLTDRGAAALYLLSRLDRTLSVEEAAQAVRDAYPSAFGRQEEADTFVRSFSGLYG